MDGRHGQAFASQGFDLFRRVVGSVADGVAVNPRRQSAQVGVAEFHVGVAGAQSLDQAAAERTVVAAGGGVRWTWFLAGNRGTHSGALGVAVFAPATFSRALQSAQ